MSASLALVGALNLPAAEDLFSVEQKNDRIVITCGGEPVGSYVFEDSKVRRPYFANLHAPGGLQVTRNHPPIPGQDATDHDTMHPGVWLAFGDINGQDFWRNKAIIRHERFTEPPRVRDGKLAFATESGLQAANGETLGTLGSRITLARRPEGYLLTWEAVFKADQQKLVFGDQEEMGLGVRVATPITEKNGGRITGSTGAKGADDTWGKAFNWCDYSAMLGHRRAGVTLMPDPANFRRSWFHNRDYGLMVANPFGRKAMNQGDVSRVVVERGGALRLRFGLLIHAADADESIDFAAAYRDFLERSAK